MTGDAFDGSAGRRDKDYLSGELGFRPLATFEIG